MPLLVNIEQAIYDALSKVDARQATMRQRVYETAWNAHERALLSDNRLNDEIRSKRRKDLMRLIRAIESEYLKQTSGNKLDIGCVKNSCSDAAEDQIKDDMRCGASGSKQNLKTAPKVKISKRFFIITLAIIAFVIICLFILRFFLNNHSGHIAIENDFKIVQSNGTSLNTKSLQEETEKNSDWIRIFHPGDATAIALKGQASINIRNDGDVSYLNVFANSSEDAAIIDIGAGVLNQLRGKKVLVDIDAKSDGQQSSQMSVTCDFGGGYSCGRRRFEVLTSRSELLFEVDIPSDTNGSAKLFITSDLLGEGHAINIYSIRMKIAN